MEKEKTIIKINNFKTIKEIEISLSNKSLNVILGKNSSGKSNILSAISTLTNKTSETIPMIRGNINDWNVIDKEQSIISIGLNEDLKIVKIDKQGNMSRSALISTKKVIEEFENEFGEMSANTKKQILENEHISEIMLKIYLQSEFAKDKLKELNTQQHSDFEIEEDELDVLEEYSVIEEDEDYSMIDDYDDDYEDDEDDDEFEFEYVESKYDLFVNRIFSENTKIRVEYIEKTNFKNILKYGYDLYESKISNEYDGADNFEFNMFLNFIKNIGYVDIEKDLRDYLKENSILVEQSSDQNSLERFEAKAQVITSKVNEILKKYIFDNFGDSFEYTFEIKLTKNTFNIIVKNMNDYLIEKHSMISSSTGVIAILTLLVKINHTLWILNQSNVHLILLLDEPEKNIFPYLQKKLINYLNEIIINNNITILYTTHQPTMIPDNGFELFVSDRSEIGETKIQKIYNSDDNSDDEVINLFKSKEGKIDEIINNITIGNQSYFDLIKLIEDFRNSKIKK